SGEVNGVSAIPEQSFLAGIEMNIDANTAGLEGERNLAMHLIVVHDESAIFHCGGGRRFCDSVGGGRRCLLLCGAPSGGYMALQLLIAAVGAGENGGAENHPGDGGANENEGECKYLPYQSFPPVAVDRALMFAFRLPLQ